MHSHLWRRRTAWLAGVAMVLTAFGTVHAQGPPDVLQFGEMPTIEPMEPIRLSDHWIGLNCRPAQDALRAQLDLPEGTGLVVELVVPDSPAAKAGIEQFDVLVKADGKPLEKLQDLIDAVDAAKEKELKLELRRGGKSVELTLKPAKRPELASPIPGLEPGGKPSYEWLKKHLGEMAPGTDLRELLPEGAWQAPWRFRFWGPGGILPPDAKPRPPLPGNMSVTITRSGDEPAKIVVKRGDEKWEVTEDQLDKLPEEIRPHLERMLGRAAARRAAKPGPPDQKSRSYDFDFIPDWRPPHWEGWPEGRLEQRLEEMNRRIDELRKSIEQLRENRPRLKAAPKLKEAPKLEEAPRLDETAPPDKPKKV